MSKDLMLLTGGHPVHRRFGHSINAMNYLLPNQASKNQIVPIKALNLLKASFSIPIGYDYFLCESCYYYPAIKRRFGMLGKTKIINMNVGPLLYHILTGRLGGIERKVMLRLLQDVDAHLVYGTYGGELLSHFNIKKPVRTIYPFIKESLLNDLLRTTPDLCSKSITIMAARDPFNKGLDIIFRAMGLVSDYDSAAKLNLLSPISASEIEAVPGYDAAFVNILNNVPDVSKVLQSSSLYVQPSRGDAFPVASLEALAAGLPTIVSSENGVKEVIGKIDGSMIVDLDHKALADAIISFFDKSQKEKTELSEQSRANAAFFNERHMLELFKKQLSSLKEELDGA